MSSHSRADDATKPKNEEGGVPQAEAHQLRTAFLRLVRDLKQCEVPTQNRALLSDYLEAIYWFLEGCAEIVDSDADFVVLFEVADAIRDLDSGSTDEILRPKPVSRRPPNSSSKQVVKLVAATACERLVQLGCHRTDAANRVAAILRKFGVLGTPHQPVDGSTVLNWRSQFKTPVRTMRDHFD